MLSSSPHLLSSFATVYKCSLPSSHPILSRCRLSTRHPRGPPFTPMPRWGHGGPCEPPHSKCVVLGSLATDALQPPHCGCNDRCADFELSPRIHLWAYPGPRRPPTDPDPCPVPAPGQNTCLGGRVQCFQTPKVSPEPAATPPNPKLQPHPARE